MAKPGLSHPATLFDDDTTRRGGIGMLVWGFGTVVAVVLGFASWQYAPPRPSEPESTRVVALPAADEVTGSIAGAERTAVPGARVIGGNRFPAVSTVSGDPTPTRRDLDELRGELRDLHKTIAQMGLSGDGVSRRLDRLEARLDRLGPPTPIAAADEPAPAAASPSLHVETIAHAAEAAEATAGAVRMPLPRPEAEQPTVTGSVPPKPALPSAAKADRDAAGTPAAGAAPSPTTPPPTTPVATAALPSTPAPTSPVASSPAPAATTAATETAARSPAAASDATRVTTTTTAPSGGVAAVDLGGHRSLAALRKSWATMSERYAEFGNGIEPLARLRETDAGMEVRLVAGPYASATEAAKTCTRMRALGVACAVTGYTGQPLAAIR